MPENDMRDVLQRLVRIETKLDDLPCKDHTAKLQTLCGNSNYDRGYRKGIFWIIGLAAGFGGSALVRLIAWALTKM